jgi:hypothetical protein
MFSPSGHCSRLASVFSPCISVLARSDGLWPPSLLAATASRTWDIGHRTCVFSIILAMLKSRDIGHGTCVFSIIFSNVKVKGHGTSDMCVFYYILVMLYDKDIGPQYRSVEGHRTSDMGHVCFLLYLAMLRSRDIGHRTCVFSIIY